MSSIISFSEYLDKEKEPEIIRVGKAMITASTEDTEWELAEDHTSEPIKRIEDVERVSEYLIQNRRWRDNMLFICGINFGLRISDLLRLRFKNLINNDGTFKDSFPILEKKTRNTRKVKTNRIVTVNSAVKRAIVLYLENTDGVSMDDYLFKCEGNRGGHKNVPLATFSVNRILKKIADDLGLDMKMSTHSLRKTFAYHQMLMSANDPRKLMLLQKIFGHSTVMQTLTYIGITQEEMADAYRSLNLGIKSNVMESVLTEEVSC